MSKNIASYNFDWNKDAWGYTLPSLRRLRNALCSSYGNDICVVEVEILDGLCGFLILDSTKNTAVFTGDGFRTDGGGEGGAGYNSAEALFAILGIPVSNNISVVNKIKQMSVGDQITSYMNVSPDMIIEELSAMEYDLDFTNYSLSSPGYIRRKVFY